MSDNGDGIRVRPDILRTIADTLDARADAGEPLDAAEMRGLALALLDLTAPADPWDQPGQYTRSEATIVSLRPIWGSARKGVIPS